MKRLIVFSDKEDGKTNDGLEIVDLFVVPSKQGQQLVFSTNYESHQLSRKRVIDLTDSLLKWLQDTQIEIDKTNLKNAFSIIDDPL